MVALGFIKTIFDIKTFVNLLQMFVQCLSYSKLSGIFGQGLSIFLTNMARVGHHFNVSDSGSY